MLNISEIVAKTETMFDLFNAHFYDGELARPAITVSPDGGRGAYGWCTVYEIWQADGQAYREINICAEYINRPISEVAGTMLHEMAHLYNLNHGIKDVSNNGYYHNKKFKTTAEARGLIVDHHDKYGWTITSPSDELLEFILKYELSDILINRNEFGGFQITGTGTHNGIPTFGGLAPRKSSSRKYACPCCGMSVRATKVVNVACLDCDEQLLLVG